MPRTTPGGLLLAERSEAVNNKGLNDFKDTSEIKNVKDKRNSYYTNYILEDDNLLNLLNQPTKELLKVIQICIFNLTFARSQYIETVYWEWFNFNEHSIPSCSAMVD